MREDRNMDKELRETAEKYRQLIYSVAAAKLRCLADADDVFQEVFIVYYRRRPEFDSEEQKRSWLIKTTLNLSKKYNHDKWNENVDKSREPLTSAAVQFKTEMESCIFDEVMALGDKYRLPVYFYYFIGMSSKEIAEVLGISTGAVDVRLSRARKMLKEKLERGRSYE